MKKHLLLSLIAAFMVVLGASAQGNSYNMVIEMANGTKINIGPNDIKNISFIDGNLTVSGESIDDIKRDITDIKNAMANLKTCQCSGEIAALKKEMADLNIPDIVAMINVLQMQIKSLMDEIDALKKNGGENNNQGNDDNQGNIGNTAIVGTWQMYMLKSWGTIEGESINETINYGSNGLSDKGNDGNGTYLCERYAFNSDGSFQLSYYEPDYGNGIWKNDGSGYRYKIEAGHVLIYKSNGTLSEDFIVNKIDTNELVMTLHEVDRQDTDYYMQYYMKRVN